MRTSSVRLIVVFFVGLKLGVNVLVDDV